MDAGVYFFTIEHAGGGPCRVDFVRFSDMDNPVEERSWGAIKGLYR
ncbi:MAG: hypothetical protein GF400_02120 [Candidatus Eisenbacteria bacterium]|nr:hypothetical protein [Candidatus Eisenbacteria bacterium]